MKPSPLIVFLEESRKALAADVFLIQCIVLRGAVALGLRFIPASEGIKPFEITQPIGPVDIIS